MTTIVEREAIRFSDNFLEGGLISLEKLKDKVSTKLYTFTRDKDKLFFLNVLRNQVEKDKVSHLQKCNRPNCKYEDVCENGFFVIDQEIESISKYYDYKPKNEDEFTVEERVNLHNKLNEIADKLQELGLGQEIIFDEIESLKENFNLGKRNWFQFLKGKLLDLTIEKFLDETIVRGIFDTLKDGFDSVQGLIQK